jgi:hypothetical protein
VELEDGRMGVGVRQSQDLYDAERERETVVEEKVTATGGR